MSGSKLLVISAPRSGSHRLGTAIGSHPAVTFRGEVGKAHLWPASQSQYTVQILQITLFAGDVFREAHRRVILLRNPADVARSRLINNYSHTLFHPGHPVEHPSLNKKKLADVEKVVISHQKVLRGLATQHNIPIVYHEDITLPGSSAFLCELMDLPFHNLIPTIRKMEYREVP